MSNLVKNIIRFCLFVLAQVFILDKVPPLHQMATPYIYFLFILWLPFKIGRRMQMLVAFVLGFAVDSFNNTYGMHAASCVLIAYIRPFLINLLISQEGAEIHSLGLSRHHDKCARKSAGVGKCSAGYRGKVSVFALGPAADLCI